MLRTLLAQDPNADRIISNATVGTFARECLPSTVPCPSPIRAHIHSLFQDRSARLNCAHSQHDIVRPAGAVLRAQAAGRGSGGSTSCTAPTGSTLTRLRG
eukprot:scaffold9753_cov22-Tisochrysis_lutea.AAC.2